MNTSRTKLGRIQNFCSKEGSDTCSYQGGSDHERCLPVYINSLTVSLNEESILNYKAASRHVWPCPRFGSLCNTRSPAANACLANLPDIFLKCSFKVIQGHRCQCQSKAHILTMSSNCKRVSHTDVWMMSSWTRTEWRWTNDGVRLQYLL